MLGKVEKYDDDKKKKDKKFTKKVKKGKAITGKMSPATSRIAMSTSTLHTPSIPGSTEEEEEADEDEREQNGSGDLFRKKEDLKSVSGKLRCVCKYRSALKNITVK